MEAAKKRTPGRRRSNLNSTVARSVRSNPRIEHLRRDFAEFRRAHPPRTRIPDSLRNAALAALHEGAVEAEVRRACGVTSEQIAQWAKSPQARAPRESLHQVEPRVFPVVEDASDLQHGSEAEPQEQEQEQDQELELRLGGWAISVRTVQR